MLAFVVGVDGKVFASLMNGQQYQAGAFTKWASEQVRAYEKAHPSLRLPFTRSKVVMEGEGADAKAVCADLDDARDDEKPVIVYFGRGHHAPKDKNGKRQVKAARKFEKATLDSKSAAAQADGWVMLRMDLSDEAHAAFAKGLGVTEAPTMLLFAPGADKPRLLDGRTSGNQLAAILKKHKVASED